MAELDDFAATYREQMPGKLEAVRLAALNLAAAPAEATGSLRRLAHSLKGSVGNFGYPQINASAAGVLTAGPHDLPAAAAALLAALAEVVAGQGVRPDTTILLIDDDEDSRMLLAAVLAGTGRLIIEAENGTAALTRLAEQPVALVVLDLMLGDTDGRNLLIKLRENPRTATTPVIVVSGKLNPAIKAECYALGADGYFEKPFAPEVLAAAVTARLDNSRRLAREARSDALTGLPNRAAFIEAFASAHAQARRSGKPLAVVILDLDKFKTINDTYGHSVGDEVLRRLACVLPGALRQTDFLARWGGEEFVLLFPDTNLAGAVCALDKAREAFKRETFVTTGNGSVAVTFSAGVAVAATDATAAEAVSAADRFLYIAKESGRDRVVSAAGAEPARAAMAGAGHARAGELVHG